MTKRHDRLKSDKQKDKVLSSSKPHLLIVDDDLHQAKLFAILSETMNIKAQWVQSCVEGLALMEANDFDLILMDCCMPDIDGFECTKMIRNHQIRRGKKIPIVAITACLMFHDRERCLEAGMDDYLPKPFTMDQLAVLIERYTKASVGNGEGDGAKHA